MTKKGAGLRQQKGKTKERGGWLTAALIIIIIRNLLAAIWIFTIARNDGVTTGTAVTILLVLASLADAIAGVAMWYWKKWGLYLFAISTVAGIILHTIVLGPFVIFYDIVGPAILAYILTGQNKYHLFE